MPELPEVETVRRGLAPVLEGARIALVETHRKDLRFAFPERFTDRLNGQKITALRRRAKYLMADLSSGDVLVMHLGMSGSFHVFQNDRTTKTATYHQERARHEKHDHVVFHMDPAAIVTFNDPRRFGYMLIIPRADIEQHKLFKDLGPEPLGNSFGADALAHACWGRKTSLKAALLDQRVVAGLGNIYVCEALFRAHLSPRRKATTIAAKKGEPNERAVALHDAIRAVLHDALAAGGSSLRDHRRTDGALGRFQHSFQVYDREGEPCVDCKGRVRRFVQNGRSTFYCPSCQR